MAGKRKVFNDEQEKFFLKHQAGLRADEVIALMKEKFGLELKRMQVAEQRQRLGVHAGRLKHGIPCRRLLNDEQQEFFIKHQKGLYLQEAADLMNKTFGLHLTPQQVKEQRHRLKVHSGFHGTCPGRALAPNKGMFEKGIQPHNYMPVGTEIVKYDGYVWTKIGEPNKWKQKHLLLWESVHGPRKPREKIIFLNGNRMDIRLENLTSITESENSYMNMLHLRSNEPEITQTGINVARLMSRAHKLEKEGRKGKAGGSDV